MKQNPPPTRPCPCGRPLPYASCCAPLHQGQPAADAESLMRSRYSAFVMHLENYLRATWHPTTCPAETLFDTTPAPKWIGLEVKSAGQSGEDAATVEFVARCRIGGRAQRMHEISRFVREEGRWYYLDGEQLA